MATAAFSDMGCMLESEVAWNILACASSILPWMVSTQARATSAAPTAAQALSAFVAAIPAAAAAVSAGAATLSATADALSMEAAALNADAAALSAQAAALGEGGTRPSYGPSRSVSTVSSLQEGGAEWGSGFVDSGVAGTGADEPAKLKEGDLNRPRYFHRKRFLENNYV